jgi:sugar-specific transcriptional regulator TrmB
MLRRGSKSTQSTELGEAKDMVVSKLREFGLTAYAARAFLSIVDKQPVSATNICKLTGIPDSKIYYALKELEEKNLIITQHGTPSLYRTLSVEQIASNLQNQLEDEHKRQSMKVKEFAKLLEPLHRTGSGEDVELAFIMKGSRNIIAKMRETIDESKHEVLVMFADDSLLGGVADALRKARSRGSVVKVALAASASESASKFHIRADKTLCCACNILIVDSEKLITVSGDNSTNFRAIVTQDGSMIYMSRQNYENPACCTGLSTTSVNLATNF